MNRMELTIYGLNVFELATTFTKRSSSTLLVRGENIYVNLD